MMLKKVGSFLARMTMCFLVFLSLSALDFTKGWALAAVILFCIALTYLFWKLYQWLERDAHVTK